MSDCTTVKTCSNGCVQENTFLQYQPIYCTFSDWELRCTWDRNVGYHEKYMNGGNTGVFKKNSVCSSTDPHENSSTTSVYIEKATYQMNSVSGGQERQGLWMIESFSSINSAHSSS